ncbi:MAG: hypothetical protein MUO26_00250 [Methanotrichaceae archaeon]|nr:hypothetical protein [Methanotrichaceae archaeon]
MKLKEKNIIHSVIIIIIFITGGIAAMAQEYPVADNLGLSQLDKTREAHKFTGKVYMGNESIEGVKVLLYCSYEPTIQGRLASSTVTNSEGRYELTIFPTCRTYTIKLNDSDGLYTVGAASDEGIVINNTSIRYDYPLKKEALIDDKFWVSSSKPAPQELQCPEGCECMYKDYIEATGTYSQWQSCSSQKCGGDELHPKYCYRALPGCPDGCGCMDQETADATLKYWQRCNSSICGYDKNKPMYCFRAEGKYIGG